MRRSSHPNIGAQATVAMMTLVGNVDTTLQGTIAGSLGPFGFSKFGSRTDDVTGVGDLYPISTYAGTRAQTTS
jgi:hypothetical protein